MEFTRTLKVCSWGLLEALYDYLSVGASAMKIADERKQVVMHISQPVATKPLRLCSNTSHRGYTLPSKSGSHDLPHVINRVTFSTHYFQSPRQLDDCTHSSPVPRAVAIPLNYALSCYLKGMMLMGILEHLL